jgi:hypothetical protein
MGVSEEEKPQRLKIMKAKTRAKKGKYIIYLAQIDKFECF